MDGLTKHLMVKCPKLKRQLNFRHPDCPNMDMWIVKVNSYARFYSSSSSSSLMALHRWGWRRFRRLKEFSADISPVNRRKEFRRRVAKRRLGAKEAPEVSRRRKSTASPILASVEAAMTRVMRTGWGWRGRWRWPSDQSISGWRRCERETKSFSREALLGLAKLSLSPFLFLPFQIFTVFSTLAFQSLSEWLLTSSDFSNLIFLSVLSITNSYHH